MSERTGSSTAAERLFQEWLDLYRSGAAPGVETFLADTPDMPEALALEVRELAAGYERLRSRIGAGGGGSKPGRLIGDFQLIRQLGAGGIGVVWEAEQLSLKRRVALKLLSPYFSLSERTLERFHREAEAGARLAHPGIVPILSVGEEEGVHFMAQELVPEGRTLADRIADLRSRTELPRGYYAGVVELFTAVAEALGHAHSQGVVHRDVKPSNILLTPDGRPKVADFGLALVDDSSDLSRTGEVMGTPYYMSPEQVASRSIRIDHRTDVFSLGATLYEALTLTRPFEGDTSQQVYEKILTVDPVDPRVVRSHVPRDLSVICTKALEKDVQRRYADMQAFAADLGRFARNEPIVARPPGPIARAVKWTKRHPIPTTGGGVAAVALIVITILFFKIRDERDRAWQQAYRASIGPAALTLERDSFQAAQELLAACPTILRGWVWKHLGLWHSRSRLSLDAFDQRVTGIAYSPDGRRLVAGCFDNSVRVFDAESGELIASLSGLRGNPGRVVFGADGKTLYAVATNYSDDDAGRVHTWDAETLAKIASWVAQEGRVDAFAISGDGARVATGGEAGFRLFDARTHALLLAVDEPGGRVWSIALDADGSRVVTGTDDETVRVWDAESGKELLVLTEPRAKVTALALDPDGRRIVAGTEAGAVHIWDARTGAPLGVFLEHTAQVSSLAIDPNGSRVVSGSEDGSVRIWDLEGRAARQVPEATRGGAAWDDSDLLWREGPVAAVTFHPLGDRVAFCLRDGSMRVVDALADEPVTVLRGQGDKILCVAFDATGERVATGAERGSLWIWDAEQGEVLRALGPFQSRVLSVGFTPDGQLVAELDDGSLRVFDAEHEEPVRVFSGSARTIGCSCVSPSGRFLATGTGDGLDILHLESGERLRHLSAPGLVLSAVRFDADESRIAAGASDGTLCLWDLETGALLQRTERTDHYVATLAFTARGDRIAYGSGRVVWIWDFAANTHTTLGGHDGLVNSICFDPADRRLFSCGNDKRILVWDVATNELLATLVAHAGTVDGLAVSPDGARLASVGDDGTLRLWETDAEQLARMGRARARHRAVAPRVDALIEAYGALDQVLAALRREPGLDASLLRTAKRLAVARVAGASDPPGAK